MGDKGEIAARISQTAARQFGHITRAQLLGLGIPARTISAWIATGKLIVVHAGVYGVSHRPSTPIARAAAAVLACGVGAVLSHASAAALWDLDLWPDRHEVTVPRDRRPPGIRTHRTPRPLIRAEMRHHRGIWVTSPARTLLDVAPRLTDRLLIRAVNDARIRGIVHHDALDELVRDSHRPSAGRLRTVIDPRQAPTRSDLEDAFLTFVTRHGLPVPEINVHVHGYEVDALFATQRLIVEVDGWQTHQDHESFNRDRERDAALLAAGYATVRITWDRLIGQPTREAQRLRTILLARAATR